MAAAEEWFPFADEPAVPGERRLTPGEMTVGQWIEVPVDDDGPPGWMRVAALWPPRLTLEHRWAVRLRGGGGEECWAKIAPWLEFRACDHDPAGRDAGA